jgi:hypothetical protein
LGGFRVVAGIVLGIAPDVMRWSRIAPVAPSLFVFTPAELVVLETVREDRPETLAIIAKRLALVVDELTRSSQGRVVTEAAAERLLLRLRAEFVARMMVEMPPWDGNEDLRKPVVDLLTRHLIAGARDRFVQRVVAAKRN